MSEIKQDFVLKLDEDEVIYFKEALTYTYNQMVRMENRKDIHKQRTTTLGQLIDRFDEADIERMHKPLVGFPGITYNRDLTKINMVSDRWNISDIKKLREGVRSITITSNDGKQEETIMFIDIPGEDWPRVYLEAK